MGGMERLLALARRPPAIAAALCALWAAMYLPGIGAVKAPVFDEAWYYPDLERYRSGAFFMQAHPPLGKFLLLAGEIWNRENARRDMSFLWDKVVWSGSAEALRDRAELVDMTLVRLPVAAAALGCCLLVALLGARFSGSAAWGGLAGLWFLLDNATVAHFRIGMLDAFLSLWGLGCLAVVTGGRDPARAVRWAAWGALWGAAMATKASGAVLALGGAVLLWRCRGAARGPRPAALAGRALIGAAAAAAVWLGSWYAHCAVARRPHGEAWFGASEAYRRIVREGQTWNPAHLPLMIRENMRFGYAQHAAAGTASPLAPRQWGTSAPPEWLLGAKPLNYWWRGDDRYRGAWLWPNTMLWAGCAGLVAIGLFQVAASWLFGGAPAPALRGWWAGAWAGCLLLGGYAAGICSVPRPMYAYHALFGLHLAIPCAAAFLRTSFGPGWGRWVAGCAAAFTLLVALNFLHVAPLTYGAEIPANALLERVWFDWQGVELP